MKTISIKLPAELIESLDELVRQEIFITRSEAIRTAALEMIRKYMEMEPASNGRKQ